MADEPTRFLTVREAAARLGISVAGVNKALYERRITRAGKRFTVGEVDAYKTRKMREAGGDARGELTRERVRLTRAQANRAELLEAETEGRLIDADRVGEVWASSTGKLRNTLLALHSDLKMERPEVSIEVVQAVRRLIRRALQDFADGNGEEPETQSAGADGVAEGADGCPAAS